MSDSKETQGETVTVTIPAEAAECIRLMTKLTGPTPDHGIPEAIAEALETWFEMNRDYYEKVKQAGDLFAQGAVRDFVHDVVGSSTYLEGPAPDVCAQIIEACQDAADAMSVAHDEAMAGRPKRPRLRLVPKPEPPKK